jgi:hypothetical protein
LQPGLQGPAGRHGGRHSSHDQHALVRMSFNYSEKGNHLFLNVNEVFRVLTKSAIVHPIFTVFSVLWIRIRIQEGKNDPQKNKNRKYLIHFLGLKASHVGRFYGGLGINKLQDMRKKFQLYFFLFLVIRTLDQDPYLVSLEKLNPDPYLDPGSVNPDPLVSISFHIFQYLLVLYSRSVFAHLHL